MRAGRLSISVAVLVFVLAIMLVATTGTAVSLTPGQAQWSSYKNDLRLTGAYPGKSNIVEPEVMWSYYIGDYSGPAATGDINNDGQLEIVTGSQNFNIYALDRNGNLLWTFTAQSCVLDSPAIGDINGDGQNEVVIGDFWWPNGGNSIYALSGHDGALLWKFSAYQYYEQGYQASPLLYDINGDGKLDVLVGSWEYHFYALDGATGNIIWKSERYEHMLKATSPIADLDKDGTPEVLTVDNHAVVKVRDIRTGAIEWTTRLPGYGVDASPALEDLNGDGYLEAVFCLIGWEATNDFDDVIVLDHNGNVLWNSEAYTYFYTSPTFADVDGDGLMDVITGDSNDHTVIALKGTTGQVLWANPLPGTQWIGGSLVSCDINDDGILEILAAAYPDLYCLSTTDGSVKWVYRAPAGFGMCEQAILSDINNDGNAEIIISCSDGYVHVLHQSAAASVDAALRVAGTKGNTVDAVIMEDGNAAAALHVLRTTGAPNEDHATFKMMAGHTYTAVLTYHAYKCGSNPTWLTVKGQTYFYNFNSQKGKVQTVTFAL